LDLVIDALEHTTLNVDSELIAAAAAAEEQAALNREQHLQQQQQHWTTNGSIGSGGGVDYYGSEGIEAREKPNKYNEEAVYEAGVYNYHPSGDVLPPPEGLAGFENHHQQHYEEEGQGHHHHEGYFVEDEDGANIDAYYDQHDQQYIVDPNHPHWHQQQHLQHHESGDQQTGSVYGSYGTGGHSSGGEYGAFGSAGTSPGMNTRFSAGNGSMPAWHIPGGGNGNGSDGGWGAGGSTGDISRFYASPALQSLCWEYYNHGVCSQQHESGAEGGGGQCQMAHGEWCETCNHYALHPVDMNAREAHIIECRARHDRLEAIRRSAHVECGICMERVIEKAIPAERRFGLLNCEHAFCLSCIRNWRQQYSTGVDVEQALRTCPICRTAAHFITPTSVWPATAEEREAIISGYKTKLQEIDCRHFNFGEGSCPFGTSCMYRHAYPDGRLEESAPRRVAADEGDVRMVQPVRLSDFIVVQRGKVRGWRR
jgi:E3 ubiquitin-protein ligase makorin